MDIVIDITRRTTEIIFALSGMLRVSSQFFITGPKCRLHKSQR